MPNQSRMTICDAMVRATASVTAAVVLSGVTDLSPESTPPHRVGNTGASIGALIAGHVQPMLLPDDRRHQLEGSRTQVPCLARPQRNTPCRSSANRGRAQPVPPVRAASGGRRPSSSCTSAEPLPASDAAASARPASSAAALRMRSRAAAQPGAGGALGRSTGYHPGGAAV